MHNSEIKLFFTTYWKHVKPWWTSEESRIAWWGLFGLIALSLISVYLTVIFNEWGKDFFESIGDKNLKEFVNQSFLFLPLFALLMAEFCCRAYLTSWLSFRWRRWMTQQIQDEWLTDKNYHKIQLHHSSFDNPDQRITEDIYIVCYSTTSLFVLFFRDGINFIAFSIILWNLSNHLNITIGEQVLQIPGLLVWAAILYSAFGIFFTLKFGRPLIDLDRLQEKYEADFRHQLMRISERREEIATLSGEKFERNRLRETFETLAQNYYSILKRNIYINLFQNFYIHGRIFVPLFIVGPLYLAGSISIGVLMQIRGMFVEVNTSLSSIIVSFHEIANLIASLQRLIGFKDRLAKQEEGYIKDLTQADSLTLEIANLTISTPEGAGLWTIPNLSLRTGERKLLMGPSGCGKTSFLRIMAGLSPIYEVKGDTAIAVPGEIMFIPQKTYMPLGTLRQCLSYPSEIFDEKVIIKTMKLCHLEYLIPLLDEVRDWQQHLSPGEQQRVNFVRVLLHRPKWLMMDEPTAQLHDEYVSSLCKTLDKHLPNSGILVIAHNKLPSFDEIIQVAPAIKQKK
jgi:putative ATP-binding cassette transporter